MECINIGLVTRGINEYGMREEGVTFYIRLYPTTITKARYYYITMEYAKNGLNATFKIS